MAELPVPPPAGETSSSRPLAGIAWMVLTGILFVGVTAGVKYGGRDLPAAESAFIRYLFGLLFLTPVLMKLGGAGLTARHLRLFAFRGFAHAVGVILWFYAMTRITIAEVTAMNYMTPIYVTAGAALLLNEKLAARRMIAIAVAFIGALIILRPGLRPLGDGHIAMIIAAVFLASSYIIAKRLTDEVPPAIIVALLSVSVTVCLIPFAATVWIVPTASQVFWMAVVAFFATTGHYAMTRAFAAAPVSVTQPIIFLQLIWSVVLGAMLFGEAVDVWVVIGGLVIVASATFIAIREAMIARMSAKAAPPSTSSHGKRTADD